MWLLIHARITSLSMLVKGAPGSISWVITSQYRLILNTTHWTFLYNKNIPCCVHLNQQRFSNPESECQTALVPTKQKPGLKILCELTFILSWIFRSKAPWFHCIVCILLLLDLVICDSETSESLSEGLGWLRGEIIKRKGGDEALQVMKSGKATLTGNHTSAFLQKMKYILSPAWEHYFSGLPFKTSLPPD